MALTIVSRMTMYASFSHTHFFFPTLFWSLMGLFSSNISVRLLKKLTPLSIMVFIIIVVQYSRLKTNLLPFFRWFVAFSTFQLHYAEPADRRYIKTTILDWRIAIVYQVSFSFLGFFLFHFRSAKQIGGTWFGYQVRLGLAMDLSKVLRQATWPEERGFLGFF